MIFSDSKYWRFKRNYGHLFATEILKGFYLINQWKNLQKIYNKNFQINYFYIDLNSPKSDSFIWKWMNERDRSHLLPAVYLLSWIFLYLENNCAETVVDIRKHLNHTEDIWCDLLFDLLNRCRVRMWIFLFSRHIAKSMNGQSAMLSLRIPLNAIQTLTGNRRRNHYG